MMQGFGTLDIAVYGEDPALISRVSAVLSDPFRVTPFEELVALTSALDRFHCLVMATSTPSDIEVEWMKRRASSTALSYVPMILINSSRPDTEARLRGIPMDDHVRTGDIAGELRPMVRRNAIRVASANLVRDSALPDILRRVFEIMCYHEPNPVQLQTVYKLSKTARTTVHLAYNEHVRPRTGRELEYVHEEIALIRCLAWKSPRRNWHDVAAYNKCSTFWIDRALKPANSTTPPRPEQCLHRESAAAPATSSDIDIRWLNVRHAPSVDSAQQLGRSAVPAFWNPSYSGRRDVGEQPEPWGSRCRVGRYRVRSHALESWVPANERDSRVGERHCSAANRFSLILVNG